MVLQASDSTSKPVKGKQSILRMTLVRAADVSADNVRLCLLKSVAMEFFLDSCNLSRFHAGIGKIT